MADPTAPMQATSTSTPTISPPNISLPAGSPTFADVQKALQPQAGSISPDAQAAIGVINQQRDYYAGLGASQAQTLAAQRGLTGSSIEQFGTQQAINQANLSALNATGSVLTQGMQNQTQLQGLGAQLTSDQLTSLQNMALSQQGLNLQQNLGQQGINLGYANITAAQQMAQQQQQNQLISGLTNTLSPYLLGGGYGGTGVPNLSGAVSPWSGLLGGGAALGAGSGLLSGVANPSAPAGASSGLFPGGLGQVGTGVTAGGPGPGAAATTGLPLASLAQGAAGTATGMLAGQQLFGNNSYTNVGAGIGGVAGGILGSVVPGAGTAIGSTLGSLVGSAAGGALETMTPAERGLTALTGGAAALPILAAPAINKALGTGGSTQQEEGSSSWQSSMTQDQQAVNLGKPGMTTNYDANQSGSFATNYNSLLSSFSPQQLISRYQSATPDMLQTPQDQQNNQVYQAMAAKGPVDPTAFAAALKDPNSVLGAPGSLSAAYTSAPTLSSSSSSSAKLPDFTMQGTRSNVNGAESFAQSSPVGAKFTMAGTTYKVIAGRGGNTYTTA